MHMQKQRIIMLIVGIVLAVFTVYIIKLYIAQQRRDIIENAKKIAESNQGNTQAANTPVLVAIKDIPKGSTVDKESVEVRLVPNQHFQPQMVTSLDRIVGMVTTAPIAKGEPITLSTLTSSKQASGLAEVTPRGKRAITVTVDNAASLVGMINPGNYVDVIAVIPMPTKSTSEKKEPQIVPLFQNVYVLAVGQDTVGSDAAAKERRDTSLITLALTPTEANLIAFVQDQGKIRLVLRSAKDSQEELLPPATWETLLQYVRSKEGTKVEKKQEPTVEIYRGLSKESMLLSK